METFGKIDPLDPAHLDAGIINLFNVLGRGPMFHRKCVKVTTYHGGTCVETRVVGDKGRLPKGYVKKFSVKEGQVYDFEFVHDHLGPEIEDGIPVRRIK